MRGIDVSEHNGAVEWGKVEGVEFVMLRLGTGAGGFTLDRRFSKNAAGARAAGLRVGAYVYSYARSVEGAVREAEHAVRALEPHRGAITFPVAYDIEEPAQAALGKRVCTDMCRAFCAVIEEAGYRPMVYANKNWLQNHLYAGELGADVWLAHVELRPWASSWQGEYVMHQYSWAGRVPGIRTDVDMNVSRMDFREERKMRYKAVEECPGWAQETVKRLVERGVIRGRGDGRGLDLTEDMLRLLVWLDRAGVYEGVGIPRVWDEERQTLVNG